MLQKAPKLQISFLTNSKIKPLRGALKQKQKSGLEFLRKAADDFRRKREYRKLK